MTEHSTPEDPRHVDRERRADDDHADQLEQDRRERADERGDVDPWAPASLRPPTVDVDELERQWARAATAAGPAGRIDRVGPGILEPGAGGLPLTRAQKWHGDAYALAFGLILGGAVILGLELAG